MLVTSTYRIIGLHFSYGCITLNKAYVGAVQPFIVKSYRITKLHYNYGNATLSADYVGYLYFQNHWGTPYVWVSTLRAAYVG